MPYIRNKDGTWTWIPSGGVGGSGGGSESTNQLEWVTAEDVTLTEAVSQIDVNTSDIVGKVCFFHFQYSLVGAADQSELGTLIASFIQPGAFYGNKFIEDPAGSVPTAGSSLRNGWGSVLIIPNKGATSYFYGGVRYEASTTSNKTINGYLSEGVLNVFRFKASTAFGIGSTFKVEYAIIV